MAKPSQENFYKKLRYFAGINESSTKETNQGAQGTLIDVAKSNDGTSYGIVKENHHYYIKKSTLNEGHKVSDFIYISGLQNKMDYQYNSLAEAEKQRNFYLQGLNEAFSLKPKQFVGSEKKTQKVDNPFQYIKETVNNGKSANKVILENRFKKNIVENTNNVSKKSLMNETATQAIRKAMGLVTEDKAISTEDSEVKDADVLSNKTGKEKPQAPINDSNAQKIADKATGKGSFQGKLATGKSIAVNQAGSKLKEEASPLVTDDSELIVNQSLANMDNATKENPQAPINDGNAKAMADKAVGKSAAGNTSLPNDAPESEESEPFDNEEDSGDEKDDIVSEAKALSTDDSEQKKADEIANSKSKIGTPEAPYNNYNQPNKGQTEKKGTPLAPKASKKDIVAETKVLSTADSNVNTKDSPANQENGDMTYDGGKLQKGTSYSMNDNSIAESEEEALDAASQQLGDLDVQIDAEKEAAVAPEAPVEDPMAGGEEMPAEDPMGIPDGVAPEELDAAADGVEDLGLDGTEEMPAEYPMAMGGEQAPEGEGGNPEEIKRELKSLAGQMQQLVGENPNIADDEQTALEVINQTVEPFNTEKMGHGTQQKIMNKVKGEEDDMGGEPAPEGGEEVTNTEELPVPEIDVPPLGEEECSECGTFEQYAESRGYPSFVGATLNEVANVLSGYINAFNEGMNDGDFKVTSKYMTKAVLKELKEYGHDGYIKEAITKKKVLSEAGMPVGSFEPQPPIDGSVELTEEDINELGWRDIKNAASGISKAGSYVGNKVGQKVSGAQDAMMNKVQQAGQFVGDKAKQAGQFVADKTQDVKQQYHQGNAKSMIQNIQQDAAKLGKTIAAYNAQAQKAGGQPVTIRSIAATISNQLQKNGGNVDLSAHKGLNQFGEGDMNEDGEDFPNTLGLDKGNEKFLPSNDLEQAINAPDKERNPDIVVAQDDEFGYTQQKPNSFAQPPQNMGIVMPKLGESEIKLRKYVQQRLAEKKGTKKPLLKESQKSEKLKQLDKMIDEQWELANKLK